MNLQTILPWLIGCVAMSLFPVIARADEPPRNNEGKWHNNVGSVAQNASVGSSNNGVIVGIGINGQGQGIQGSPGQPRGVIGERPRSGQHYSGPGFSVPGRSTQGTPP